MAGSYFNLTTTSTTAMTFGGTALTCLQSITVSGTAPNTEVECGGATAVTNVVGLPRYTMSVTGALGDEDDPLVNAVLPATAGAITCDAAGTATDTIDFSSTNASVTNLQVSIPVNGFSTYQVDFVLDNLTTGANS